MSPIGQRIRESRREKGWTQTELARKAGVSQGTVGNAESGLRGRPRELINLARALGVRPEWLESGALPRYVDPLTESGDPKWAAQFNEAQMELLHAIQLYGAILTEDQCRGIAQMIRGSLRVPPVITDEARRPARGRDPDVGSGWTETEGNETQLRLQARVAAAQAGHGPDSPHPAKKVGVQ